MKCPNCKGNGSYYSRLFGRNLECAMCNGSGFVEKKLQEQTNEEWLRSASTEELAEWLARKLDYCANMDCENCPVEKECNDGINDYSESELWEKWLKEKHI